MTLGQFYFMTNKRRKLQEIRFSNNIIKGYPVYSMLKISSDLMRDKVKITEKLNKLLCL